MSQNGKGDTPRFYPDKQYKNNYNKIFGEKMRTTPEMYLSMWLSEQIPAKEWLRILNERKDVKELFDKNQIVKIDEWNTSTEKIRVTDNIGKVWWIEPSQVSCSFL